MKTVIVIGAGPVGLAAGLELKKLGLDPIIIDERADQYTRAGHLNPKMFTELEKALGLPITRSSSYHIKDLERSLYKSAIQQNIPIIEMKFEGFTQQKKVHLYDSKNKIPIHLGGIDLILDATGPKRAVIKAFNKIEPNSFIIEPSYTGELPPLRFLLAYVEMTDDDINLFHTHHEKRSQQALKNQLPHLEYLRDTFGWTSLLVPDFYVIKLMKNKRCFYVEIPPTLESNQYEAWLKAVLKLKTNGETINFGYLKQSRKYPDKKRFYAFTVHPKKVMPIVFEGYDGYPTILPIGDAQSESRFDIGNGIPNGIERLKLLLQSMEIYKDKSFSINYKQYESLLYVCMTQQNLVLQAQYKEREKSLANIHMKYYDAAELCFQEATTNGQIKLDAYGLIERDTQIKINTAVALLSFAMSTLPLDQTENFKLFLKKIAYEYRTLGIQYGNSLQHGLSILCFRFALAILKDNLSGSIDAIFDLKFKIAKETFHSKSFARTAELVDEAISYFNQNNLEPNHLFFKLFYFKTIALLNLIQDRRVFSGYKIDKNSFTWCSQTIENLKVNSYITNADYKSMLALKNKVAKSLERPQPKFNKRFPH